MASRPISAQSRRAWGSVDQGGGCANPALDDDDDLMPAAMESELYAPKQPSAIAMPPPEPRQTGCWATVQRGIRCKCSSLTLSRFIGYTFLQSY